LEPKRLKSASTYMNCIRTKQKRPLLQIPNLSISPGVMDESNKLVFHIYQMYVLLLEHNDVQKWQNPKKNTLSQVTRDL
jgi:hypothetical protein